MTTFHNLDAPDLPIQSVTVFKSNRAQVVRILDIDLKDGDNVVIMNKLPNSIDANSIRVSGFGGSARLADVVCIVPTTGLFGTRDTGGLFHGTREVQSDATYALGQRRKTLEAERVIREQEAHLLLSYGESISKSTDMPPSKFSTYLDTFRAQRSKGVLAVRDIEDQLRTLEEKIAQEIETKPRGTAKAKVTITLHAEKSCKIFLRLAYHVSQAQWNIVYDLYASTTEPNTVSLHYRAQITQSTGESWADTQLTLSTTDAQAHEIPNLGVYRILPTQPFTEPKTQVAPPVSRGPHTWGHMQPQAQTGGSLFGAFTQQSSWPFGNVAPSDPNSTGTQTGSTTLFGSSVAVTSATDSPSTSHEVDATNGQLQTPEPVFQMREGSMTMKTNSLSSSFTVEGKAIVPSDGAAHTVSIASFNVFLRCRVENATEYRLLPGFASVFLDEEFVSKSKISEIGRNDFFECTLGVDRAMEVSYELTQEKTTTVDTVRSFGDSPKAVTNCQVRTTIKNTGSSTIKNLVVQDVLPIPSPLEKDTFKVVLRKPQGLSDASADELVDVRSQVNTNEMDQQKLSGVRRKIRWSKRQVGKGGEEDGRYDWVVDVLQGEELSLVAAWDIRGPTEVPWREVAQ
ncbi:hypothetical protein EUX98_g719 [Antrodiella citrinella]|uniref:DUF4139 domain-containing protein n=1 Tax=Antrodiella citrinella TaxID=2447956 RepID=A0A4V3XJK5_9APHY|nr:hypothetical protein EUX98_g719 [Antrodiella citrinella]